MDGWGVTLLSHTKLIATYNWKLLGLSFIQINIIFHATHILSLHILWKKTAWIWMLIDERPQTEEEEAALSHYLQKKD
jgi:hypothetical protein